MWWCQSQLQKNVRYFKGELWERTAQTILHLIKTKNDHGDERRNIYARKQQDYETSSCNIKCSHLLANYSERTFSFTTESMCDSSHRCDGTPQLLKRHHNGSIIWQKTAQAEPFIASVKLVKVQHSFKPLQLQKNTEDSWRLTISTHKKRCTV